MYKDKLDKLLEASLESVRKDSIDELMVEVKSYDRPHGEKLSHQIINHFFTDIAPKFDTLAGVEQALHALYKKNNIQTTVQGVKQVISNYAKRLELQKQKRKPTNEALEELISEKNLSAYEKVKREKYVKSLKRKYKEFKAKYGEDAESVIYATATKLAKND